MTTNRLERKKLTLQIFPAPNFSLNINKEIEKQSEVKETKFAYSLDENGSQNGTWSHIWYKKGYQETKVVIEELKFLKYVACRDGSSNKITIRIWLMWNAYRWFKLKLSLSRYYD